jgi:phosphatidylserine/phosphatidylglycerophosphate/cardiolipin synthase-like enzyme
VVVTDQLLDAVDRLAQDLPPAIVHTVAAKLASMDRPLAPGDLMPLGSTQQSRERLAALEELMSGAVLPTCPAVALALRSSLFTSEKLTSSYSIEIAWTGPGTPAVPVRRVDQVMYELVENAVHEIILTSFVTYGAEKLLRALHAASQRGVDVKLILERAEETDGKLSFDGIQHIRAGIPQAAIFFWPLEKRLASRHGKRGILHVKCLLCDESQALVSSANLTDFGLELNMELGLVLHGGEIPACLAKHFMQLIYQGDLRKCG